MTDPKDSWIAALTGFAAQKRAEDPVPPRSALTDEEEQQCRILGGHLISWLEEWGPNLILERNVLADMQGWDKNPHVVFLTSGPGLTAAREILHGAEEQVTWLTTPQFQEFLVLHPDEGQVHHCILESWFRPASAQEESALRASYPIPPEASLRIHHDHSRMAPLFTRGGLSLWSSQKGEMKLIEEGYQHWLS
ncbi:MAG: hypothetical protein V4672_00005 [Verrucomicrobiota bacterium]